VAHTSNTGSMLSCLEDNAPVMLSVSDKPARKTKFTWEMIFINNNWVGINTALPNFLAEYWLKNNSLENILPEYTFIKREYTFLDSRIDLYAENETEKCLIEVKNVTYRVSDEARFPDAKSIRAQKHLNTLMHAKKMGYRAVMIYVIQRNDVTTFAPAAEIDAEYARLFYKAVDAGVEILPIRLKISADEIVFDCLIPFKNSNE
jgi:sugar fermentation stimulation protein A